MSAPLARLAHEDRASSLVEFALTAPLLVLLIVGIVDVGRALNAYVLVNNLSREGATYAVLNPNASTTEIQAAVKARSAPLDANLLAVSASYIDGSSSPPPWPPPAADPPRPVLVRVEVRYPWSALTWLAGSFFVAGSGRATFTTSSTMETWR